MPDPRCQVQRTTTLGHLYLMAVYHLVLWLTVVVYSLSENSEASDRYPIRNTRPDFIIISSVLPTQWLELQCFDKAVVSLTPGWSNNSGQVVHSSHPCVVSKQYNLLSANGRWCFVAGKVTVSGVVANLELGERLEVSGGAPSGVQGQIPWSEGHGESESFFCFSMSQARGYFSPHLKI